MLAAYVEHEGRWSGIYEGVMLSDPLEDEERYREWIEEAIEQGGVESYKAFVGESKRQKDSRMKNARREGKEMRNMQHCVSRSVI